jgi:hypothetical protein
MVNLLKVVGLILGVALVGGCAVASSSSPSQAETEPDFERTATVTPVEPSSQGRILPANTPTPGEFETATFALG